MIVYAFLAAGSAAAKEGVEATLLSRIPVGAHPGSSLRVEWRLAEVNSGRPFDAGGVFVRLVGAGGAATSRDARETGPGRFVADVTVPVGGVRRVRIGLHGWTSDARGTHPGDELFRIVNDPFEAVWTALRRALSVPTLGPGRSCPVAHVPRNVDFARFGVGRGIGPGPAYPIGWPDARIPVRWQAGDFEATRFGVQKVLWFVDPRYRGPVLVRGVGLDNPFRVRFERGRVPPTELRLPAGMRHRPSFVRIREPGCYAFQIDGLSFSRSIVFRALRG